MMLFAPRRYHFFCARNSYLSGDSHAEERAVQRIHSGTASKALRFDEHFVCRFAELGFV